MTFSIVFVPFFSVDTERQQTIHTANIQRIDLTEPVLCLAPSRPAAFYVLRKAYLEKGTLASAGCCITLSAVLPAQPQQHSKAYG
jgi:hypothetical protein